MQATDGVMTYHDLQVVWPYGPIRLDSLTFLHQTGTHATLRLTGIVPEDKEEEIIHLASNHDGIGLYGKQGAAKKPIFMGRLQHVEIKVVRDIHYVTIQAISHTYAMDLSPKTRSFQQVDRLYRDVVEEALSVYPGGDFIDQAFDEKKQGKFIMQYEETDWTFVRRIASHVGAVLVPDVSDHKVRFWIGMPEGRKQIKLEAAPYEVNRAIAPYMKKAANGASSLSEYQYTTYTFAHDEWLHIGDEVQRDGRTFVITKVVGTLEQGLLKWTYVCAVPESVKQTKLYNSAIIGAAIDGKIIQVGRNQVKIHLNMDQKQDASKAQWFPYAAEGNQILYLMPELGSKVKLYFPGAEEDDGMVMNSVRHAPQGEAVQKQAKKMQDPGVKSFGNPQGKEFTLGDKELTMTAQEGMLYISMNKDAGVSLHSASQVRIQASGGLNLRGSAVTLTASEGLSIKTIVDHMGLQEEISASSEEIKLDATTRRSFPHLWSAFEEKVQSIGVDGIIKERIQANMDAEVKVTKEFWSENMSAFWAATVDTADIVFSTLSFGYSENVYEWASGKEVGSLTERNLMVQGLQKTAEDAFTYAEKVITGEKSKLEVAGDALDAGWGILKEAVEPFIEEAQYLIEDAKGGKWTRSIEESYEKGRNSAKKDLVILELVGSRGLFGAYRKAVKKVRDQGGNDSKASHTSDVSDHEQGQQKDGNGAALPLQGANDHHRNSTGQKDGKLKTKAEIPLDEIQNLQDVIDLLILKMNRKLDGRIVIGQTSADGIGGVGGYHVFFEADQRGRGGSKDKGGETRRTERTGNDAYGGYFKRKQQRTEEYNSKIADKQKIVGDDTNGYRLVEPTKWMEQMGMTQIKEKLKRKSWSDNNGFNWQWDSQHGKLEKWNKRRTEHLGEFDPVTGKQTKDGEPKRRWDG
ncbi:colicin E3/pyocin S6 family cytotoxin [Brevibacillus parabrevis]|uniref:colicin E3/pyocin S6 family cytotoxin n=2 Tax=Brevibacillus TaxID=55080 RepID=UPI001F615415|nr:colicin E3/pyocin S6 family cytotoxin [Brevibacillus parabrevis]MDR4999683.1 colicin E3/pyocin S6 family cytotoxin [Brevibacillus parabrevis]